MWDHIYGSIMGSYTIDTVSYTHLDVYKRQELGRAHIVRRVSERVTIGYSDYKVIPNDTRFNRFNLNNKLVWRTIHNFHVLRFIFNFFWN